MLAMVGAWFLLLSGPMVVTGSVVSVRRGRGVGMTDVLQWIGLAGFIVWALILLGAAAWLVSLPFVGVYALFAWIEDASAPGLVFPVAVALLLVAVGVAGWMNRRAPQRTEPSR